jgi:hypothetical protein
MFDQERMLFAVPDSSFGYRDAIAAYNVQVDLALKYFTFLQVVGAATIGLVVSNSPNCTDRVVAALAFTLFAGGERSAHSPCLFRRSSVVHGDGTLSY